MHHAINRPSMCVYCSFHQVSSKYVDYDHSSNTTRPTMALPCSQQPAVSMAHRPHAAHEQALAHVHPFVLSPLRPLYCTSQTPLLSLHPFHFIYLVHYPISITHAYHIFPHWSCQSQTLNTGWPFQRFCICPFGMPQVQEGILPRRCSWTME